MNRRYALTDRQWAQIQDLLPGRAGHVGAPAKDNRLFVDAVLYRYRAGIAWRDLPERFGDFRVVHLRHMRWSRRGVWQRLFEAPAQNADNEYAMIDATIVRAHQHSAGGKGGLRPQAIGRSRGGLSTKIHATVDALGNPTGFVLTAGQASDLEGADVLLKDIDAQTVIADKAYDAHQRVVAPLLQAGKAVVIPSIRTRTVQREYDRHLYKARHLIENFFARLKQYRAIATRYDKTATAFLGAIHLAAAITWLI
ncbi:IS5 family transposase [Ottowia sp.]|uniref:IS5 family transposase n=1 Tax=Ottowia sp. TaxID=1898956 RepID=UPI0039E34358